MIWSGDGLDWAGFSGVNLGREVMNSSTFCASRLPPQTQKSNNTPLNLKKECRKKMYRCDEKKN
jgi:hypothetical protein